MKNIESLLSSRTDQDSIDEMTMVFLESKGFDRQHLQSALDWIKNADPDELMLGEGNHDEFDVAMGEIRRPMLIKSVERLMKG